MNNTDITYKKIIASIDAENETREAVLKLVAEYDDAGCDGLYIYNYSKSFEEREAFISTLRLVRDRTDIPFMAGVYVDRLEDVKKAYYSGASKVCVNMEAISSPELLAEACKKIGGDNVYACVNFGCNYKEEVLTEVGLECLKLMETGICGILAKHVTITPRIIHFLEKDACKVIIQDSLSRNSITSLLELPNVDGIATNFYAGKNIFSVKKALAGQGLQVSINSAGVAFADMKKNEAGLVPCIVQDYKTSQVLMMAYMNEEAYNKTLETGIMTYFSRSRNELWVKGETSGHYQYVKSMSIDCDSDTLLARVKQIGAACHTGNYSCFFTDVFSTGVDSRDINNVLTDVYNVILDRKKNPKEGSYTNYLFDKGIDKILKKCGEEATEIVIAAKNPDSEELRYEIADFLYHCMVLMVECGLDWEDIGRELASRE